MERKGEKTEMGIKGDRGIKIQRKMENETKKSDRGLVNIKVKDKQAKKEKHK